MSRFKKLSQAIWHCHYHIIWRPKYPFKILTGSVAEEVSACILIFSERQGCHHSLKSDRELFLHRVLFQLWRVFTNPSIDR